MGYSPVIEALISAGRLELQQVEAIPDSADKLPEQQLLESGVLVVSDLLEAMTTAYGIPAVCLADEEIDGEAVTLVPQDMAMNCKVLPLRRMTEKVVLAMADPHDVVAEDFVRFVTGFEIERVAAMPWELVAELEKRFKPANPAGAEMFNALEELAVEQEAKEKAAAQQAGEAPDSDDAEKEKEASNSKPVVKAVHSLLSEGVLQKASDIHFEPVATGLRVRYRIDGYLREITELPKMVQPMVLSRIKLQSGMDISEKRKPQDGRTRLQVGDREIDFRVSSLPTFYGEKVVMRILDSRKAKVEIEIMGWSDRDLKAFLDFIRQPQGAILITGPTGSGKTSTLYAALSRLHTPDVNIVTVEDPVEFQISGINQVQVNNKAGLTFANALRSILRQDPNIVMLGEIRDSETANIAFEAAMTGHLVLSTLHTNDAPSAISRLIHIGVPNYMVAASLVGIVAQRLVRKLCQECKEQVPITPEFKDILGRSGIKKLPETMWSGQGCKNCGNTGYTGRMGIFEVLRVTEAIKAGIYADSSEQEMKAIARAQGMNTLLEDGLWKAERGLTSLHEVLSVAPAGTESDDDGDAPVPAGPKGGGPGGGHGGGHGGHGKGRGSNGASATPPVIVLQMPNGATMPLGGASMPPNVTMPVPLGGGAGATMARPGMPMGAPGMMMAGPGMPNMAGQGMPTMAGLATMPVTPTGHSSAATNGKNGHIGPILVSGADSPASRGEKAVGAAESTPNPPGGRQNNSMENPDGSVTCVCGNTVPASQPYCNVCGTVLDSRGPGGPSAPTPPAAHAPAPPIAPPVHASQAPWSGDGGSGEYHAVPPQMAAPPGMYPGHPMAAPSQMMPGMMGTPHAGMNPMTGQPMMGMGMNPMGQPMMGNPMAGMGNSMAGMGYPMAGMGNPMAGMGNQMGGMGNQMGGMGNPMAGMGMNPMMGQMAQMVPCHCGAYNSPADKFCKVCGTISPYAHAMTARAPMMSTGYITCTCGTVHPASQRFCNVCGATLGQNPYGMPGYGHGPMHGGFGAQAGGGYPPPPAAFPPQGGGYAQGAGGYPQAAPVPPPSSPPPNNSGASGGRRERVLVVDDDPDLLSYVQRVLELEFYEVTLAHDGTEGLNQAFALSPDLIICDISMPGMDGVALCKKLRAHPQTRLTPIILLTGLMGAEDESRGLEAGADDYLTKPVNPTRLVARVESHLRRARMRQH